MAACLSQRLGMSRRRFLRTSCGMAAAFAAMNEVFGPYFRVSAPELTEQAASREGDPDYFILDAWKGYPGQPLGPNGEGWWLDDEKLAYPALALARELGVRNVCLQYGWVLR